MLGGRDRRRSDGQVHRCWVPALRTDSGTVSSLLPRDPRAVGRSDFGSAALCSELRSTRPATAPAVGHRCGILVRRSTSNGSGLAVTRKGAERRTTTRTVWTWTVRDGQLSTRSSSWMAEAIRYASADFENTAMDVGLCIGHTRGDAVRGAPGRMPDREIPRVWCRFEPAPLD